MTRDELLGSPLAVESARRSTHRAASTSRTAATY